MEIKDKLEDHEGRIKKLEENDIKQSVQLANIQNQMADVKATILDLHIKSQDKINEFTTKILDSITAEKATTQQIRLIDRKEFWGAVALIIGSGLTILTKIFC